jgi:hypothetical protein
MTLLMLHLRLSPRLQPFPKNPWFVPPVPVGDALREEIYKLYCENPHENTPRQLAVRYELSVLRIEAILRLKHLEKKQMSAVRRHLFIFHVDLCLQGNTLQSEFRKGMETLLGVRDYERIRETPDAGRQLDTSLTPQQRFSFDLDYEKNLMNEQPSSGNDSKTTVASKGDEESKELGFARRADGNYILPLSGVVEVPEQPPRILESTNPRETNKRWKFMVTDIGEIENESEREMRVREHDGTLRTATRLERKMQMQLYPLNPIRARSRRGLRDLWEI